MKLANDYEVVMVDDNRGDLDFAKLGFKRAGLRNPWLSFTSGEEFWSYLHAVKAGDSRMPAIVLLDINMPGMSGIEVLRRVQADEFFGMLPIFCVLTSSTDSRDRAEARTLGASGFLTKPVDLDEYVQFFKSLV